MSKIATVRALNDSEPQLQIVAAVRDLQQLISSMQSDLSSLPQSVAAVRDLQQIMSSMQADLSNLPQIMSSMQSDLSNLPPSVAAVRDLQPIMSSMQATLSSLPTAIATELSSLATLAESLDTALTAQRRTLDTLSRDATASLEQRLTEIMKSQRRDATQLRQTLEGLQASVRAIERAANLPRQISDATDRLEASANQLSRTKLWLFTSIGVASAVLSAALAVGGMHLLNRAGTPDLNRPVQQSGPVQSQGQGNVWERVNELARER